MDSGLAFAAAMLGRDMALTSRSEPRRPLPGVEIKRPGPEVRFEVWRRIIGE